MYVCVYQGLSLKCMLGAGGWQGAEESHSLSEKAVPRGGGSGF